LDPLCHKEDTSAFLISWLKNKNYIRVNCSQEVTATVHTEHIRTCSCQCIFCKIDKNYLVICNIFCQELSSVRVYQMLFDRTGRNLVNHELLLQAERIREKCGLCRICTSHFKRGMLYLTIGFTEYHCHPQQIRSHPNTCTLRPFQRTSVDYSQRHSYKFGRLLRRMLHSYSSQPYRINNTSCTRGKICRRCCYTGGKFATGWCR
jgi:hypothetical protein